MKKSSIILGMFLLCLSISAQTSGSFVSRKVKLPVLNLDWEKPKYKIIYKKGKDKKLHQIDCSIYSKELEKVADEGNAQAQYALACFYHNGNGIKKNEEKTIYYVKKAAADGLPEANYSLGVSYDTGMGVPMNKQKAFKYFIAAAEKDYYVW